MTATDKEIETLKSNRGGEWHLYLIAVYSSTLV
jgi:hypothetical protein